MEITDIILNVGTILLSGVLSVIVSKYEFKKNKKEEKFKNFYNEFIVLRDLIHKGRAFDFSDLQKEDQEKIVKLLIETDCYQNKKISNYVYELKTNQLDNFNNFNKKNIEKCNEVYTVLSKEIYKEYEKLKKKL